MLSDGGTDMHIASASRPAVTESICACIRGIKANLPTRFVQQDKHLLAVIRPKPATPQHNYPHQPPCPAAAWKNTTPKGLFTLSERQAG